MGQWLPDGYELKSGDKDAYTSIPEGKTTLRILSKPLIGYVAWTKDKKPVRHRDFTEFDISIAYDSKPIPFWAMIVYNYEMSRIQVWELTKVTLMKKLKAYVDNEKWGDPIHYDIQVSRKGVTMETTEYELIAEPKSAVEDDVKTAYKATPVNLQALLTGDNPFEEASSTQNQIDRVLNTAESMNLNTPKKQKEVPSASQPTGEYDDDLPF